MNPPTPSQELAVQDMPDQAAPVVAALDRLSNDQIRYIANTEIVPKHLRGRPDAMLATIIRGRALGFDDIHSLTAINFIDGRATLSAEAMAALVRQRGHSLTVALEPGVSASATGRRKDGGDEITVVWTMGMAKDAGLAGKDNWKRHPDTMLQWRAISQLCRFLFGDILMGVSYTEDEALEASERGAVTQAVTGLPGVGETQVRTEALSAPSEAQLNRIVRLEERLREHSGSDAGFRTVLRGVYGVEMASELDADAATKYEAQLEMALPPEQGDQDPGPDSARPAPPSGESVDESAAGATSAGEGTGDDSEGADGRSTDEPPSPADADSGANDTEQSALSVDSAPEPELPGEPAPDEDEVVEGELVAEEDDNGISHERMVELAAETTVPLGDYKGKRLDEMHDGWIEWALEAPNTARLPEAFAEALVLFARERKTEIWEAVRGG